jgi:serine protease Do
LRYCMKHLVLGILMATSFAFADGDGLKLRRDQKPLPAELKARTSFAPMIKRVAPSVVTIQAGQGSKSRLGMLLEGGGHGLPGLGDKPKFTSLGSGVILTEDGYIITNNHVIKGASRVQVVLHNKRRLHARVVGTDAKTDVAVLKVTAESPLPAVQIGDSDTLEVGDMSFAFGNPFGVGQTVTRGMISALKRGNLKITQYDNFIQTDAAINKGNSGGALIDAKGRLIGINTAIISSTGGSEGIGLAIPINQALEIVRSLVAKGKVIRGFVGVTVEDLTPAQVSFFKLDSPAGAIVTFVTPESVAEKAGLTKDDVIVRYNDSDIKNSGQLRRLVAESKPGQEVRIAYLRKGARTEITLNLTKEDSEEPGSSKNELHNLLAGVRIGDLTPRIRNSLKFPAELSGTVTEHVLPGCPAAANGLMAGDVILKINRDKVKSAAHAVRLSKAAKGKSVLLFIWRQGRSTIIAIRKKR